MAAAQFEHRQRPSTTTSIYELYASVPDRTTDVRMSGIMEEPLQKPNQDQNPTLEQSLQVPLNSSNAFSQRPGESSSSRRSSVTSLSMHSATASQPRRNTNCDPSSAQVPSGRFSEVGAEPPRGPGDESRLQVPASTSTYGASAGEGSRNSSSISVQRPGEEDDAYHVRSTCELPFHLSINISCESYC